jgi:uncharacterized protein (TIGR02453 family)
MAARFSGIPADAFEFYDELAADNSKAWWAANKARYDASVREPLEALMAELGEEFGQTKLFRPYRDVRFSKDKSPYKDHQGAYAAAEDGIGWYLQVSRDGLMAAGGWYSPQGRQLARYRDAVDSAVGSQLEKAIAVARRAGYVLDEGDLMKTRPRGVPEDHPRLDLLRHRQLTLTHQLGAPAWASGRGAVAKVRAQWRALTPLVEWLVDHVGPYDDGVPPEPE